jgi:hypothetical protein
MAFSAGAGQLSSNCILDGENTYVKELVFMATSARALSDKRVKFKLGIVTLSSQSVCVLCPCL